MALPYPAGLCTTPLVLGKRYYWKAEETVGRALVAGKRYSMNNKNPVTNIGVQGEDQKAKHLASSFDLYQG